VLSIRTQVDEDLVELGGIGQHSADRGIKVLANLQRGGQ
jgi:hypothetical protein